MTTLAIDIGGTKLAAALIGADGQIRDRRELPTPASQTPEALRDALSALVSPLQAHAQRVAIASTGIIRDGSLLALNPHNLGGLLHFPLVKTLEQLTDLPTIAINDAQAAAWAEYQALEGDVTEMVFITVSTGVGGGVVSGGKLLTGPGGLAGHIGHTLANPHGPVCGCGRTGCVEAIASGRGIAAAAQGELAGADARTIFTRAGQGDEQAQQLIHRSARTLARLSLILKPQLIASAWWSVAALGWQKGIWRWWKRIWRRSQRHFMLIYWRRTTATMQVYLGLRCWPREKNYDDG